MKHIPSQHVVVVKCVCARFLCCDCRRLPATEKKKNNKYCSSQPNPRVKAYDVLVLRRTMSCADINAERTLFQHRQTVKGAKPSRCYRFNRENVPIELRSVQWRPEITCKCVMYITVYTGPERYARNGSRGKQERIVAKRESAAAALYTGFTSHGQVPLHISGLSGGNSAVHWKRKGRWEFLERDGGRREGAACHYSPIHWSVISDFRNVSCVYETTEERQTLKIAGSRLTSSWGSAALCQARKITENTEITVVREWTRSSEPMWVIKMSIERRRNEGEGETGDLRENPQTNGIVHHGSHIRKFGSVVEPELHKSDQNKCTHFYSCSCKYRVTGASTETSIPARMQARIAGLVEAPARACAESCSTSLLKPPPSSPKLWKTSSKRKPIFVQSNSKAALTSQGDPLLVPGCTRIFPDPRSNDPSSETGSSLILVPNDVTAGRRKGGHKGGGKPAATATPHALRCTFVPAVQRASRLTGDWPGPYSLRPVSGAHISLYLPGARCSHNCFHMSTTSIPERNIAHATWRMGYISLPPPPEHYRALATKTAFRYQPHRYRCDISLTLSSEQLAEGRLRAPRGIGSSMGRKQAVMKVVRWGGGGLELGMEAGNGSAIRPGERGNSPRRARQWPAADIDPRTANKQAEPTVTEQFTLPPFVARTPNYYEGPCTRSIFTM
ncbi:hypothetical protein PR048_033602 [Dryococelus australis]|uniref:Uncharacterized protein n=1 Tax=Dryococelus australis TaxID=614101 RepID=A0ABQ9G0R3_9NEOP|nr:hypothetical protein PR048_033602 [Dryococelus australis]